MLLVEQNVRLALEVASRVYLLQVGCVVLEGDTGAMEKQRYREESLPERVNCRYLI